ncbi:MAG TPA: RNA methyltransferase [Firmicutes bacterium]|nr:RNA methyltransferase [Bacillota bacterium]HOQ25059.1 RNA methyltransferase [Bacillota bacterium]HPT68340.1 RNA methyltransferase [Bacillota bacterium]
MQITSKSNPLVKELRRLKTGKGRRESGLFLVEGPHLVAELLSSAHEIVRILVGSNNPRTEIQRLAAAASRQGIPVTELSEIVLRDLSDTEQPQGILAVVKQKNNQSIPTVPASDDYLALVIDGVQDPGNLGVLIRTAWAFGAKLCLLTPGTVDRYNPKAVRATMGGIFHLETTVAAPEAIMTWAAENGVALFAGDPRATVSLYENVFPRKASIIVGNEGSGLSGAWKVSHLVKYLSIPLPGQAESLNVSTAAAIILYEAVRQRLLG